ncbi:hypothetical protein GO496_04105 [Acidovorax citrulli]|nr:hypothetical protein [Paracidovorax citrulli]
MVAEYSGQHRHHSLPKRPDGKHMTPPRPGRPSSTPACSTSPPGRAARGCSCLRSCAPPSAAKVTLWNQDYQAPG